MSQPTQHPIPTSLVSKQLKHLNIGVMSVKRIKDMGFMPVFEIDGGRGGCYWPENIAALIEEREKITSSPKPKNKNYVTTFDLQLAVENANKPIVERLDALILLWSTK